MKIRNGEFLDGERQPIPEFYELVNTLQQRLEYAKSNTILPEKVDMNKVNDFVVSVNEQICRQGDSNERSRLSEQTFQQIKKTTNNCV